MKYDAMWCEASSFGLHSMYMYGYDQASHDDELMGNLDLYASYNGNVAPTPCAYCGTICDFDFTTAAWYSRGAYLIHEEPV